MYLRPPVVAIVTPFDSSLRPDLVALKDYLHYLGEAGIQSIVVNGTTAEFASLTLIERKQILEAARTAFRGQITCHISTTCVHDSRELLAHAAEHADAALLLPPYYFADVPEDGVVEFFNATAGDSVLPLYVYNFPRHTQVHLTPEILKHLREVLPELRGLKDSGGSFEASEAFKQANPELEIYVGADSAVLRTLQAGMNGSVTGGGNPIPREFVAIQRAFEAGDLVAAENAQSRINQWTNARKAIPYHEVAVVKAALSERLKGFPIFVRPPLVAVAETEHRETVRHALCFQVK